MIQVGAATQGAEIKEEKTPGSKRPFRYQGAVEEGVVRKRRGFASNRSGLGWSKESGDVATGISIVKGVGRTFATNHITPALKDR